MLSGGGPPVNPGAGGGHKSCCLNIMPGHDAAGALGWRRQETYVGGSRRDTPVDRITVHASRGSPRDVEVVPRGRTPGHRVPAHGAVGQDSRARQAAVPRGHRRPHARGRRASPGAREGRARRARPGRLDGRPRLARGRRVGAHAGGRPLALPLADAGARLARRAPRAPQRQAHGMEGRRLRRDGRTRRVGPRRGPRERGRPVRGGRAQGAALDGRRAARRERAAPPRALGPGARADSPRPDGHPRPPGRPRLRRRAARRGRPPERGRDRGPHVRDGPRRRPPRGAQEDSVPDAHAHGREDRPLRVRSRRDRADAPAVRARRALDGAARDSRGGCAAHAARAARPAARPAVRPGGPPAPDRRARGAARDRGVGQAPRRRPQAHVLGSRPDERDPDDRNAVRAAPDARAGGLRVSSVSGGVDLVPVPLVARRDGAASPAAGRDPVAALRAPRRETSPARSRRSARPARPSAPRPGARWT